ncbi:hypothetical protein PC129_g21923 [Phytophthora cactorum]|nr:hypothetical protein Pcac1_g745 [Phytophthora cactorum]KAG2910856.1 hypothetical protein PC117_g19290 [Phytophthora cactorum]KAG2960665.1 hypothetical protein PC118_g22388 [Phytophthora cactorum]KAG2983685.1 hypothetical protein PC120_g24394 [Phytophthora cactorum]KAG2989767.1 hypothetical protein PC119_g19226 [Phytophthora cactorum]
MEMPGFLRDTSYPEEMNVAHAMTSRWVTVSIKTQYAIAVDAAGANSYCLEDDWDSVAVRRGSHDYTLQKTIWECTCEFAQTMKLRCLHAMALKKSIDSPFVVPFTVIASR